jgi:hypothetical protein
MGPNREMASCGAFSGKSAGFGVWAELWPCSRLGALMQPCSCPEVRDQKSEVRSWAIGRLLATLIPCGQEGELAQAIMGNGVAVPMGRLLAKLGGGQDAACKVISQLSTLCENLFDARRTLSASAARICASSSQPRHSRKLTAPARATMMWSKTSMPTVFPASCNCSVRAKSSSLGVGSPDG